MPPSATAPVAATPATARRQPLWAVGRTLTDVCMGREPADTVVLGGRLVNVHTREVVTADVAIRDGRVAMFGDVGHTLGPSTRTIDADGAFLVPGLIDTHIHVESALVSIAPFAEAALRHGTTAILLENHDMANVFGLEGMRWMAEEARDLAMKVFHAVPSAVPPSALERSGARVGPDEVREALGWEGAGGLGEVMNMAALVDGDSDLHDMIAAALQQGLPVTGHWALAVDDPRLHAYAATGVDCCHESVTVDEARAKLRAGMWVQLREGSAWHDVETVVEVLTTEGMDSRHVMLIADDVQPQSLVADGQGHMNNAVRVAVEAGLDPLTAITLATLNPAEYLGRRHDLGSIAPGRCADILVVERLEDLRPHLVLTDGEPIGPVESPFTYPERSRRSVHLPPSFDARSLRIPATGEEVEVRAIGIVPGDARTEHRVLPVPVTDGRVEAQPDLDLAKVANVSRHVGQHGVGLGFIQGLGLQRGAIAQTIARDTHHLLTIGVDDDDMVLAARTLRDVGGGIVVVDDGEVLALVELPIAGLFSDRSVPEMADEVSRLNDALARVGCTIEHSFMWIAVLAVTAIPELRITNDGLFDARNFAYVDVVVG